MITLKEIAQEAGVSTTTVSNVLNGNSSRVSADTAERIQAIMKRSGYVPNQAARSLAQRESHVVAIIVQASPGENIFRNPYTAEYVGALTLELPPLRSRSDEIPSLSSLYLNSLNLELGKQISGFEPRAIEMLRQYPWPNNYTQFKNLLRSLATLTNGPYIRSSSVADLLSKERSLRSAPAAHPAAVVSTDTSRTLESIIGEVVQQTVAAHGGNRAAAARQLGISRTTLWRYLGKLENGEPDQT